MDFTALRYFHETARLGSIRAAAERLHVTPSSISRMIVSLEQDMGARLFERSSRGMRLTDAGTVLSRHTQRTFRDFERVRTAIDDLRGLRKGQVTLYGPEGLVADVLPLLLTRFRARFPAISFNVFLASTDRIVEALVNDEADIGITFNGPVRSDLSVVADYAEPIKCLVSPDHPLAGEQGLTLRQILRYPLALPEASFGMRRLLDRAIHKEGLYVNLALNTNSLELAKRLAMSGCAIAFMPEFMVRDDVSKGRLQSIRVHSDSLEMARVSVCIHRDREISFAVLELMRSLQSQFAEMRAMNG